MSINTANELGNTSSIGAVWPPQSGPYDRIRGFYTEGVIKSRADCEYIGNLIGHYQTGLENQAETRLSIRFLTEARNQRLLEAMGVNIEASIPLHNSGGLALVYAAHTQESRAIGSVQWRDHRTRLEETVRRCSRPIESGARKLERLGYNYRLIDRQTPQTEIAALEQGFRDLYAIFGYDEQDVRTLLTNPANTIVLAERDGVVASTAMAERADIHIENFGRLSMYEITEASTHQDHRGIGLYRAVSRILIDHLIDTQNTDPVHAVYGESNLTMTGVILAGHDNGRRFSYFDRQGLGLQNPNFGILEQNFKVEDGMETRPYNDFAVSYLPLDEGARDDRSS